MFDFNKLDFYRKFMNENGINSIGFTDDWEVIINESIKDYNLCNYDIEIYISCESFEGFKKKVAAYFLNK